MRQLTYFIASTLDPADHPAVTIVGIDPLAHVPELKQADGGGIWLCGGGRLTASLVTEIDRLVVKLNPVTAGAARPSFDGAFAPQPCAALPVVGCCLWPTAVVSP